MQRNALRARTVMLLALASCTLSAAGAETAVNNSTVSAADFVYRSPFPSYKRYSEQPVESWIAANNMVGRIGGWRAYAREAQTSTQPIPSVPQSSPKQQAPAAGTSGHSAHH